MTKEIYRTNIRQWFATLALAAIATAIPVTAMVPAVAAPTTGQGIVQVDRSGGQAAAPPYVPPPAPHGCGTANCYYDGQDNNGCGRNSNTGDKSGCDNNGTGEGNNGPGNRPYSGNALGHLSSN
ncbi:hypothetical protein K7711_09990 [Nocardia sp. CA2R105]|uniref:hypothetical protein n=1 Tax=Nocardia coffeae TaxID=2873381 RepID=UPI001CA74939|nr:hypothetical protein [Nocardia coffeae]MBY8856806.1 hypothetical protein [Nocardia coffeae]